MYEQLRHGKPGGDVEMTECGEGETESMFGHSHSHNHGEPARAAAVACGSPSFSIDF